MDTTVVPVRLTVIGAGYLGLTHAVCMADLGHEVLAIDVDAQKIEQAAGRGWTWPGTPSSCGRGTAAAGAGD
jgi:UDP-N-acetyl-D-mannosaminuronate dehydrogenase